MSGTPRRGRAVARLIAATVLLPLAALLLGIWEAQRGPADLAELEAEQQRLAGIVRALEARMPTDGRLDIGMQFRRRGQAYVGPLALSQAREALGEAGTLVTVAGLRRHLPAVVIVSAGLAAALSAFVLLAGAALGRAGRASREVLVRGFSIVRRVLPGLLAAQIILAATAFVAAVAFEGAALLRLDRLSGDEIKLLGLAAVAVGGTLWVAGSAAFGLRRALVAFEPDPLPILGRPASRADAPGLWRLLDGLAERLGALRPDNVVVGLTEGFFVSSGRSCCSRAARP